MRSIPTAAVTIVFGLVCGCGGSGGPSVAGGSGVSWKDDGTPVTPSGAGATLTSSGGVDSYRIDTVNLTGGGVTIFLSAPTPVSPQTFDCNQLASGQSVMVVYVYGDGRFEISDQSCTVVVTQAGKPGGPPLVGTFQAIIKLTPTGTKAISNGVFNVAVLM